MIDNANFIAELKYRTTDQDEGKHLRIQDIHQNSGSTVNL